MNDWLNKVAPLVVIISVSATACSSGSNADIVDENPNVNIGPTSSEGGQIGVFNPNATRDVFACEASYYLELRGNYLGKVTHVSTNNSICEWEVNLQIRGEYDDPTNTAECLISASYKYELSSGNVNCADGSLSAPLLDPLSNPISFSVWDMPEWPQNVSMQLAPSTDDGTIIPLTTLAGDARTLIWHFDGEGDVLPLDTNTADGELSGMLVKR